jgi:hypothetical protein
VSCLLILWLALQSGVDFVAGPPAPITKIYIPVKNSPTMMSRSQASFNQRNSLVYSRNHPHFYPELLPMHDTLSSFMNDKTSWLDKVFKADCCLPTTVCSRRLLGLMWVAALRCFNCASIIFFVLYAIPGVYVMQYS